MWHPVCGLQGKQPAGALSIGLCRYKKRTSCLTEKCMPSSLQLSEEDGDHTALESLIFHTYLQLLPGGDFYLVTPLTPGLAPEM